MVQLSLANELVGRRKSDVVAEEASAHHDLSYDERQVVNKVDMKVVVKDRTLNMIFTGVMTLMVVVNTVNMGGQLDMQIIKDVFKKPIGPAVGFFSQFVCMPLVSERRRCSA